MDLILYPPPQMKFIFVLLLLLLASVCALAEQKSRKWYEDRWLLRIQGGLMGAAIVVIFL